MKGPAAWHCVMGFELGTETLCQILSNLSSQNQTNQFKQGVTPVSDMPLSFKFSALESLPEKNQFPCDLSNLYDVEDG